MHIFQVLYKYLEHAFIYINQFVLETLAQGPIPQHVAFIMDGNRRYAKGNSISIAAGYLAGAKALVKVNHYVKISKLSTIDIANTNRYWIHVSIAVSMSYPSTPSALKTSTDLKSRLMFL